MVMYYAQDFSRLSVRARPGAIFCVLRHQPTAFVFCRVFSFFLWPDVLQVIPVLCQLLVCMRIENPLVIGQVKESHWWRVVERQFSSTGPKSFS